MEIKSFLPEGSILFYAVQAEYLLPEVENLIAIENPSAEQIHVPVITAVGCPGLKRQLVNLWQGENLESLIFSSSVYSSENSWGSGVLVAPGTVITSGVILHNSVHVNVNSSVSHDTVIGSYSTISPGVHIGGGVSVGEGVFIGIGAIIKDRIRICSGALIGAGAVVVKDITVPGTYVGNPARLVSQRQGWQALLD